MKRFRKSMIFLPAALLIVFTAALSGCGGEGPPSTSSAVENSVMANYEQLARSKDIDGIRSLLKDLKKSGDYDSIGAILTKEDVPEVGKKGNADKISFDEVYDLLAESPSSLPLELWQARYTYAFRQDPSDCFALLKKYNAIVRSEEITLSGALRKVTEAKEMYTDQKSFEDLKNLCGSSKSGKVLIVQEGKVPSESEVLSSLNGTNFCLMAAMDPDRIPSDYKDAQYIIHLNYTYQLSGRYTNGSDAAEIRLQCELIDCATGKTMMEKTYEGSPPPATITKGERGVGSPPEDEKALDFIASALRRV